MVPKEGRRNGDGSISFPQRGSPPAIIDEDYEEDQNDPYKWIMKWNKCSLRVLQKEVKCVRSGKIRHVDFCTKLHIGISPLYCNADCSVAETERNP
jgi:hypothetical protein